MKTKIKNLLKVAAIMAFISTTGQFNSVANASHSKEPSKFDGNFTIKAFVESTRKEYFDEVYSFDNPIPKIEKKEFDKAFSGVESKLNFVLKSDINETSFFDIKENLYVRHYNKEDPSGLDSYSYKVNDLDHNLRLTYGVAIGIYDYLQLDYINNITNTGEFDSLNYHSNKGKAMIIHDIADRSCIAFTGSYEERRYDADKTLNFKDARGAIEFSTLLPGRDDYIQISSSSRGEKSTFEKVPNGMATKKVIDYYTSYKKNPRDNDPSAKYICRQARGDIYIRGFGEVANRDFAELNNDCKEVVGGFETIYKASDDVRLRLNEIFTNQDFKRESNINHHHDGKSNYIGLSLDYDCTDTFSQSLTYSNELSSYKKAKTEDNKTNSVTYESFYAKKAHRASFLAGTSLRKYDTATSVNPDETETRFVFGYDYSFVKDLTFKFKAEYADLDYHSFEDEIFSNYKRTTWRVALEKGLGKYLSCELAFQSNDEKHSKFTKNDIIEKTVGLSLLGRF